MSEPKKYEYVSDGYTARFINPKTGHAAQYGEYVRWEDYARLKAEVDELRLENQAFQRTVNEASAHYDNRLAENARLKAEVERLTKAGDAMLSEWASGDEKDAKNFLKALVVWHAAKWGKPQP